MSPWVFWILYTLCVAGTHAQSDIDAKWKGYRSVGESELVPKQKVLILTMPRSGSTFIGEIFQQNPDFMYLFEAARAFSEQFVQDGCKSKPSDWDIKRVLKATYNCNFTELIKYSDTNSWRGHMYSWERIATFSGKEKTNFCVNSSTEAQRMSVAMKEIEMWAPKLNWLNEILGNELRVVWLIRDVRGWVSSWLVKGDKDTFYKEWGYDKVNFWMRYSKCEIVTCGRILDEHRVNKIQGILSNVSSPPHLKMAAWWTLDTAVSHYYFSRFTGKMLLVKYEDVALQPYEMSQQIYSFLDRPHVHEQVLRYLAWATKGGDVDNRYNTYRNSAAMAEVWRSRLSKDQIKEIEDIAGIWFSYFGYERAEQNPL